MPVDGGRKVITDVLNIVAKSLKLGLDLSRVQYTFRHVKIGS
jgi:hypothetical protein